MHTDRKSVLPRRALRRSLSVALLLGVAWLCFRLFEPVLVWNLGWRALPEQAAFDEHPIGAEFVDPAWRELAAPAAERLRETRAKLGAPAVSAAVAVRGTRLWASATGFADLAAGRVADIDARFRLGSTSKAVTSVAMGTLLDAGHLDLDLPVTHYIPDLAPALSTVSTRQAMSHTAGVRNYGICLCFPIWEHLNRSPFSSGRETLRIFENDALLFAPGEGFAYTSHGYNIAGAVLEAAAAMPFLDYLQQEVFGPLRMIRTGGDHADSITADRAVFYETQNGQYKTAFRVDNSNKWPSGGLLSTPSDMLAIGHAMISDDLLSAATRDRLLTPQRLANGQENPQGYALGWRVSDQRKLFDDTVTTRIISHHGTAVGSTSYFAVLPEYGLVISVMINKGQDNVTELAAHATAIIELFLAELLRRDAAAAALAVAAPHR